MKKFIFILIGSILFISALIASLSNYLLSVAVTPESQRRFQIDECYAAVFESYPEMKPWLDSLQTQGYWRDTFLLDHEGLRHHAVIFEQPSNAQGSTVVLHGYDDNAPRMLRYAYLHYEVLKRNVIVPEHYFHGQSEGDHIRFGWLDRLDVTRLWIPLCHELWPEQQMVVHGLSMGGALTMFTAGEEIPDTMNLIGYIEDCGFTSIQSQLSFQLEDQFGLPSWPLLNIASLICQYKYGWSFEEGDVHKQLAKCTLPMLFIHGMTDSYVPTYMVYDNYEAKTQGYKEIWLVPDAEHAQSIHVAWEEYCQHCRDYINKISNQDL